MNKTPICHDTDEINRYQAFMEKTFRPKDESIIAHELTSEYIHSDILILSKCELIDGDCAYISIGMSARPIKRSPLREYKRIELMLFSTDKIKNDTDVINELVELTKFPFKNSTWLGEFHTISASERFEGKFGFAAFLILPAMTKDYKTKKKKDVKILPILPIYKEELEILKRNDKNSNALRRMLFRKINEEDMSLAVDSKRENLALGIEQKLELS